MRFFSKLIKLIFTVYNSLSRLNVDSKYMLGVNKFIVGSVVYTDGRAGHGRTDI